jgi:hypothetical protein
MNELVPKAAVDLLPEGLREYALYLVGGAVCIGAVIVLMLLLAVVRFLFGGRGKKTKDDGKLAENLADYPELKKTSGDRQLRAEGVPVRMRLVVMAPAGTAWDLEMDEVPAILEKVIPGLGEIYKYDKPRIKIWPTQVSYQGFANHFHKNMKTGGEEGEQTRWVLVAGRIKVGKKQYMLGVALQSIKPNTIGRQIVDSHEWATILKVRVKE